MERNSLEAVKRERGKSAAKASRRGGLVPGILYGKGYEPVPVAVNEKALEKAITSQAGMNVILDLNVDGKEKVVARIRDYKADPISRNFTHVDFQVLDLTQKISVEVPVVVTGKAKGVKEGGILVTDRRVLNLKCLPTAIPENISVDITELDIGDSIHINNLKLPQGVECPHDINFSIVSVVAPMKEEEVAAVAEAVPVEGAVPVAGAPGAAPGAPASPVGRAPGAAPGAAPATTALAGKPAEGKKAAPGAPASPAGRAPVASAAPAAGAKPAKEKK